MGKVNVYLPDELEDAVRSAGISISAVCQLAITDVLSAMRTITATSEDAGSLSSFVSSASRLTPRLREILSTLATSGGDGPITPVDVLTAIVHHGENLGAQMLRAAGVELPAARRRRTPSPARRERDLAPATRECLGSALRAAIDMRHNYIGAEHVVIALAEESSPVHDHFAAAGVDATHLRRLAERMIVNPWSANTAAPRSEIDELRAQVAALADEVRALAARVDREDSGRRRARTPAR